VKQPDHILCIGVAAALLTAGGCGSARPLFDADARAIAMYTSIETAPGTRRPLTIISPKAGLKEPADGWPAIVFLHGRGECGDDGVRSTAVGLPPVAIADPARWPCVIIVPQKPGADETWESHEGYVMAALEQACRVHRVDRSRIYLTGLSQGGAGTWAIAARNPTVFAAIAPVCGFAHTAVPRSQGVGFGDDVQVRAIADRLALADTPIWAFHGERDDVVPPEQTRRLVSAVEAARGGPSDRVRATYFPRANHNSWDPAYRDMGDELARWLLGHRLER
jgi:predicted peptidase